MIEFMLNQTEEYIIATIIGLATVLIPVFLYLHPHEKKALSCQILSSTNLFSNVRGDIKRDLKISYKDKPIEQLHLIAVRILNSGNVQIVATDYERPISFSFGKDSRILTAEIVKTHPEHANLHPSLIADEQKAVLEKTLLNSGDSIILKMAVSNFSKLELDYRIAGVKQIEEFRENNRGTLVGIASGCVAAFVIGYFLSIYIASTGILLPLPLDFALIIVGLGCMITGGVLIFYDYRKKEKYEDYLV
jgi:hypothetical protein